MKLNEPVKGEIAAAINRLKHELPKKDIKKLKGQDGYRMRVGKWRILFDIKPDMIAVYKIAPRGQAYKEN